MGSEKKRVDHLSSAMLAGAAELVAQDLNACPSIVGVGASAGGLEAFEQFFRACPADSGMAFVLVPHLDPGHVSLLTEIIQRVTAMPVLEAVDQLEVEPNHVYVIPPNRNMAILHRKLQLSAPAEPRGLRMPVDFFLRSLAEDQQENAVGIILSGTGSDGTLAREPALVGGLSHILTHLRTITGHDFSLYKRSTVGRRIERRMAQHAIDDTDVYAHFLKENPAEARLLFKELLINVTSFFRDADAFVELKKEILPALLNGKPADFVFQVWVAACATGEEAYSIAILLRELMDEACQTFKVQIYSTDLDDAAIAFARAGIYPLNIAQDVSPERLQRFFAREEGGYRVKKEIREMIVFAIQNVIKDPPFTRLDLLCCRNLMIYLEPELQSRLLVAFHDALKPGGVLFLSPSESVGNHTELFSSISRNWKLYRANPSLKAVSAVMAQASAGLVEGRGKIPGEPVRTLRETNFFELTRRLLPGTEERPSLLLETSNEELQSVNAELQAKIEQLSSMQNDMKNLLENVSVGIIFLDQHLSIRSFTREAMRIYRLAASDLGQTLNGIKSRVHAALTLAEGIVETIREPQIVLDSSLKVVFASRAFYDIFRAAPDMTIGRPIYELGDGAWNSDALRKLLESTAVGGREFPDYPVEHDFPEVGHKKILLNARRFIGKKGDPQRVLLSMQVSP